MIEHGVARGIRSCRCDSCLKSRADYMREYRRRKMAENPEAVLSAERAQHAKHRESKRARKREYYKENREAIKAKTNAAYHADIEASKARRKVLREVNSEKIAADKAAWYREHKQERKAYVREYSQRRRDFLNSQRRKYLATPNGKRSQAAVSAKRRGAPYTVEGREYLALIAGDPCSYCGEPGGTVDHIVPVARGGTGDWDNLAAACLSCNAAKGARSLLSFLLHA